MDDPVSDGQPVPGIREALGEPYLFFVKAMARLDLSDDARRRTLTADYRRAVERAAARGMETAPTWHALAVWTEEGKERIGFFSRALDCQCVATTERPPATVNERRADLHLRADSLFEIGRVHAHEGEPAVARDFFEQALPLARAADALRAECSPPIVHDDRLEGRILELLLQLPGEEVAGD